MPAAGTDTSDFATERQGWGRPFQREATVDGMWSGQLILGAVRRLKVCAGHGLLHTFRREHAWLNQQRGGASRETLKLLARRPVRLEKEVRLDSIRQRDEEHQATMLHKHDWLREPIPELQPTYGEVAKEYVQKEAQIPDPTSLILVDEADRLRMASLKQVRAIFDEGQLGLILIGMPGLEKRLARYPQFYSRIGFVHDFAH